MNPGQPPSAEPGRQQIRGEPEPIPGQLTLPGMPSPTEAAGGDGQATLPGLEFPAPDGPAGDGAAGDGDLAAVAAELRALDGDGSRMAAAIRGALDMLLDGQSPSCGHLECAEALAECIGPHRVDDRRFHGQVNVAIVERHLWDRYRETVAVEAR